MKITLFLLVFVTFQAYCENGYSQNAKVKITGNGMKIEQLLTQIEDQTDYLFVYNKKNIDLKRAVNVKAENTTVAKVLEKAFAGTDICYVMEGKNIVLTKNSIHTTEQQSKITISGTVTDTKGEPIIGANILEKGTSNGSITDLDGNFSFQGSPDGTLVASFVGYKTQEIPIKGQTQFIIKLEDESLTLDNVVVTAMGIKKKAASLTYSTQQIGGDELTRTKDPNMITALAGKTAGVQISKNSSGLGGSAKVLIRGVRSANADSNNQPLYVIDGVPMLNTLGEQASTTMGGENDGANRDGGDGISNLNPDDIESMSILKGASAAALYGSQAANGVILITTKKGHTGMQRVTFSSNLTVDHAICLPELQNEYGQTSDSDIKSWGTKGNLQDYKNPDNFFQNGVTAINSIAFQSGKDNMQTYFSYANTTAKGIIEHNKLQKHNLNFRETADFFNNYLHLDANINLMTQSIKNRPTAGGYYLNPLIHLYTFPRGVDIAPYKDEFEVNDPSREIMAQNWITGINEWNQNPYWLTNRIESKDKRTRAMAALTANLKITDWLNLQARGNVDFTNDMYTNKMYATTAVTLVGTNAKGHNNGRFIRLDRNEILVYGDFMAMANKKWTDWSLNAALGTSINSTTADELKIDSHTGGLYYANLFTVSNINVNTNANIDETINQKRTIQSIFGTAQVGWKESLYLDVTARNDWSSTLAYTKHVKRGFFYPSVGLSWVMNNSIDLPEWISFGKLRASWAKVGNDLPLFVSNPYDRVGAGGKIIAADAMAYSELKPEMSKSWEAGMEWKFFDYRLGLDLTYYRTNTTNQLLRMKAPTGSLRAYYYMNAGNIQNEGVELTLDATPVMTKDFRWKTSVNVSKNKNKIKKLDEKIKVFQYGDLGTSMMYAMKVVEGGEMGDIYGNKFNRDENNNIIIDENGLPSYESGSNSKIGNINPKCLLGWGNTFTFKDFSLYFLIDARFGGDILSITQAELDNWGVSQNSADARNLGYVEIGEGKRITDVEKYYTTLINRNGVSEPYLYSATNVRLRELSLGYTFPKKLLQRSDVFKEIQLSLVARNLFFFYKDAPFDPDASLSSGNTNQGVDSFGMPTTRSIGFNVKFTF